MAALRVLLVGLGQMGLAYGRAYDANDGYQFVGLFVRSVHQRTDLPVRWADLPCHADHNFGLPLFADRLKV